MNEKSFNFRLITSFESACKALNVDPTQLPDVSNVPEEFAKPIIAHYKLMVIYKAINNGWVPDWSNWNQRKYYSWYAVLPSGSGFSASDCYCTDTYTSVGSRLCTDTAEKALYIAEVFEAEYKDMFLYSA